MKKLLALILLAACSTPMPKPEATDKQWRTGDLVAEAQPNQTWCAIASSRMLMSSKVKNLPSQCEIASKLQGESCCDRSSLKCERAVFTYDVLTAYGYKVSRDQSPSFSEVVESIKVGVPVAIHHYWRQGTADAAAHAVVAYWAFEKNGKTYLGIYDPLTDSTKIWDDSYVVGNMAWIETVKIE